MGVMLETLATPDRAAAAYHANGSKRNGRTAIPAVLAPWVRSQAISVTRHAAALRPFRRDEFGSGSAAPSESHIQAVNGLISSLRRGLLALTRRVGASAQRAANEPATRHQG